MMSNRCAALKNFDSPLDFYEAMRYNVTVNDLTAFKTYTKQRTPMKGRAFMGALVHFTDEPNRRAGWSCVLCITPVQPLADVIGHHTC